ncbi:MAG: RNA polymerase sigma factor, partial [Planctomycetota bacterium]
MARDGVDLAHLGRSARRPVTAGQPRPEATSRNWQLFCRRIPSAVTIGRGIGFLDSYEASMPRTDTECIRLCLDGRPEAYRHLVRRHEGRVLSYLTVLLGDSEDAAEAAQETFVRAYFALQRLRKPESFSAWLVGIAGRGAKEAVRDKRRQREIVARGRRVVSDDGEGPSPDLRQAVASLPQTYRQVILLRYYGGLSCAGIGAELGV